MSYFCFIHVPNKRYFFRVGFVTLEAMFYTEDLGDNYYK